MKISFLSFVVLVGLLCSCNSGDKTATNKDAGDNAAPKEAEKNLITFKVDGQTVTTSGYNIGRFVKKHQKGIRVTTNMYQEARSFNIDISGIIPGTYEFVSDAKADQDSAVAYGSYFPAYVKEPTNIYYFDEGSFVISSLDTLKGTLNATFSGKALNTKKQAVTITEGRIVNGEIKPVLYKY